MSRRTRSTKQTTHNNDGHVIGLDIGATAVRAAVLGITTKGGGRPVITAHGLGAEPLPTGAVVNGAVTDPAAVTQALQTLWQRHRFKCRKVILGAAHPQAVVRPLEIPHLSPQQRAKALPFQAREIIALPIDEVVLDYAQLGDPDPATGLVQGLLIATPRRPLLDAVAAVQKAGLTVARIDLSSFGALRSVAAPDLGVQAVVDIGAHLTSIVIHRGGVPRLVRTVARGGQQLTELIVEESGVQPAEAERLKCDNGLTGPHRGVSDVLHKGLRPLLTEIRSSLNYFRTGNEGAAVEGIALTGGGSHLVGLAEAVRQQVGIPVVEGSALSHLTGLPTPGAPVNAKAVDPGDARSATAVSIGLALGAAA